MSVLIVNSLSTAMNQHLIEESERPLINFTLKIVVQRVATFKNIKNYQSIIVLQSSFWKKHPHE